MGFLGGELKDSEIEELRNDKLQKNLRLFRITE